MPWLCDWCQRIVTPERESATLSYGRKYGTCPEHGRRKCIPTGGEIKRRMFEYPYIELWDDALVYDNPNLVSE